MGWTGDGTQTSQYSPVTVQGLSSGVASIDAGAFHSCAVTHGGTVHCWYARVVLLLHVASSALCLKPRGLNDRGQLGDGSLMTRSIPGLVSSLPMGVSQVSAGNATTCALTVAGMQPVVLSRALLADWCVCSHAQVLCTVGERTPTASWEISRSRTGDYQRKCFHCPQGSSRCLWARKWRVRFVPGQLSCAGDTVPQGVWDTTPLPRPPFLCPLLDWIAVCQPSAAADTQAAQ